VTVDRVAGLAEERPWMAFAMSVGLLSLLGFPGTFGFIGKWSILSASIADGERTLPVILVLTSVVSAGYYLPIIMSMYMRPAPSVGAYSDVRVGRSGALVLALMTIAVLVLGFFPRRVMSYAEETGQDLNTTYSSQGR
jgi:NADH-quinone oxidoreductase subunit N